MKFRHHAGVRLALISGHVTNVGTDWRGLEVIFHQEALAKGCECDQGRFRALAPPPAEASPSAVVHFDTATHLRKALLEMVKTGDSSLFTADHLPIAEEVEARCGFSPDKGEMLDAWRALTEELGEVEGDDDGDGENGGQGQGDTPTVDAPTVDTPTVDAPTVDAPTVDAGTAPRKTRAARAAID